MKKVLITGGAGFIGSNIVESLLEKKYAVACVDNFADNLYDPKFKEENISPFLDNPDFTLYREDICNFDQMSRIFKEVKPNYVIHLAAMADTRKAVGEPNLYMEVNIQGTLNILELSREYEIENMVFISSSSVYGNSSDMPWSEDNTADRPLSPYGMTKRAGEMLAYTYHHNFGLNVTCLRYFNAYGKNNRPDLVPYLWAEAILSGEEIQISGDGERSRDYTYVNDVVRGTILAMEKPLGFEIINIGNSNTVSLDELLATFEKVIGVKAKVRTRPSNRASVETTFADISKAERLLGWKPEVSIEEGVRRLVDWLKSDRLKGSV